MSICADTVTRVSFRDSSDYLPRLRTVVACIADSAGFSERETNESLNCLAETCAGAFSATEPVRVAFGAKDHAVTADVLAVAGEACGRGLRLDRRLGRLAHSQVA